MVKKKTDILKYCAGVLVLGILMYNSVFIRPLDEMKTTAGSEKFDPKSYARDFWQNALPKAVEQAADAGSLLILFQKDMPQAVEKYAQTLGIASSHAYLLKGEGQISAITDDGIVISLDSDESGEILLQTFDLFGNAVRDASGMIDVNDFSSTMEFNTISAEINSIVRIEVVQPALAQAAVGKKIAFTGAVEVSEDEPVILPLPVIPIDITWKE